MPYFFSLFSIPRLAPRPLEDPKALYLRAPPLDSCAPPHSLHATVRTQAAQECGPPPCSPSPKPLWNPLPRHHAGLKTAAPTTCPAEGCVLPLAMQCLPGRGRPAPHRLPLKVLTERGYLFVPTGEGWGRGATPGTLSPQQCPPVPEQDCTSAQGPAHQPFSRGPGANSPWGKVGVGPNPQGRCGRLQFCSLALAQGCAPPHFHGRLQALPSLVPVLQGLLPTLSVCSVV